MVKEFPDVQSISPGPLSSPVADTSVTELHRGETCKQKTDSFVPGGIHTRQAVQFWRNTLQAGDWVLDVLENGYSMPLEGIPPIYEERNNGSASFCKGHSFANG